MDHVLVAPHQPGDRRDSVTADRGEHHHRPAQPPLPFMIGQPAHPDWICHPSSLTANPSPTPNADRRGTKPANVHGQSTSIAAEHAQFRDRGLVSTQRSVQDSVEYVDWPVPFGQLDLGGPSLIRPSSANAFTATPSRATSSRAGPERMAQQRWLSSTAQQEQNRPGFGTRPRRVVPDAWPDQIPSTSRRTGCQPSRSSDAAARTPGNQFRRTGNCARPCPPRSG
ncbi:hypothetical protein SAMN05421854_11910 [Amycolatopsis rubida]|uniref:Uncharacterized protein n=1 Tax=Amycolatopsis rubida TaxID=112413 RepID=A0A1I6AHF5_9PSEU|nr:hypothetical protein SAMN05421854_11910 [Amycolatopsis rubida]